MNYLAYGSNLHPARLQKRVPSASLSGVTALEGWRLHFHKRGQDGSAKCSIQRVEEAAVVVHGAVFRIDPDEKGGLDRVEGVGFGYTIETLELPGFGEVFTYIASPDAIDATLKPFQWYHALVLAGCDFHQFPEDYRQSISEVDTWVDPDRDRHKQQVAIIENP